MKIGKNSMKCTLVPLLTLFFTTIALFFVSHGDVKAQNVSFPTYGSGAVQVRMYTDFFCPPCRGMKPAVEPLLKDLVKRNIITLTMVDTPFYRYSGLYARYFLYAIQAKNDFEHAMMVRNTLFEATDNKHITTAERIEDLFRNKKIPFTAFDPKSTFEWFNSLLQYDKVNATPSCVIVRGDNMEMFVGGEDIINALQKLQQQ